MTDSKKDSKPDADAAKDEAAKLPKEPTKDTDKTIAEAELAKREAERGGTEVAKGSDIDYSTLKVDEAKKLLKDKGLPTSGTKDELHDRLRSSDHVSEPANSNAANGGSGDPYATSQGPLGDPKELEHEKDGSAYYVAKGDTSYENIANLFGYPNFRELAAFNGVQNSRYEVQKGQRVNFPRPYTPGGEEDILNGRSPEEIENFRKLKEQNARDAGLKARD